MSESPQAFGDTPDPLDPPFIVGVGASAGGLEALEELFQAMPADTGAAFVVIQHLSPDFESMMDELLGRRTAMPILRAETGMQLHRDTIYLIPPGKELAIRNQELLVTARPTGVLNFPIDLFFRSLASELGPRAIAIVLSGTGTDGSRGIREIRDGGGLVLVQDELSAKFSGMPVSAAATGQAHAILTPGQMPNRILEHARQPRWSAGQGTDQDEPAMAEVGSLLLDHHGMDLSQYKPMTVMRRLERRMTSSGVKAIEAYLAILRSDEHELAALHSDLLIGVTKFFRDPKAFERLRVELEPLFENAGRDGPRVWVPGCATGQEAYTLAALLREHALQTGHDANQIKVFATDVNRDSLAVASAGIYAEDLISESPDVLRQHFDVFEGMYRVQPDLRRMIVFAPHNLLKDPPFTRLNMISCRNLLIYLTPAAQRKVITIFHFALQKNGLLLLGPSESLGDVEDEFDAIDHRVKLFRKRRDIRIAEKLPIEQNEATIVRQPRVTDEPMVHTAFHTLLQRYVPPTLMVNERHQLVHVFGDASKYLAMGPGRTSLDIESVLHPDLRTPVIAAINRIRRTRNPISYPGVTVKTEDEDQRVVLAAEPIRDRRLKSDLYLISVEQDTQYAPAAPRRAADAVERMNQLQAADLHAELRATEERLETTIEELETSNEELQATNEELLSSNEEMQSTNEELQSVNEELYTVNAEHQRKIAELVELNQDLDNLIRGTAIETLFLDRELRIRRYSPSIARSFSLLPADVGRPLSHLASNLEYDEVLDDARQVLETHTPLEREVVNAKGIWLAMGIRPYRTSLDVVEGVILTFADITTRKQLERQLQLRSRALRTALDGIDDPVLVLDHQGHRTDENAAARRLFESFGDGLLDDEGLRANVEQTLSTGHRREDAVQIAHDEGAVQFRYELDPVLGDNGQPVSVVCTMHPISPPQIRG